jgi:hypothetical protein
MRSVHQSIEKKLTEKTQKFSFFQKKPLFFDRGNRMRVYPCFCLKKGAVKKESF